MKQEITSTLADKTNMEYPVVTMDKQRETYIQQEATKVKEVLSQLPVASDNRARTAANLVYEHCRKNTCRSAEEFKVWDEVFNSMMPLGDTVEEGITQSLDFDIPME